MKAINVTYDYMKDFKLLPSELAVLKLSGADWAPLTNEIYKKIEATIKHHEIPGNYLSYFLYSIAQILMLKKEVSQSEKEATKFATFIRGLDKFETVEGITLIIKGKEKDKKHRKQGISIAEHPIIMNRFLNYINDMQKYKTDARPEGRPKGKTDPATFDRWQNIAYNLVHVIGMNKQDAKAILSDLLTMTGYKYSDKYFKNL